MTNKRFLGLGFTFSAEDKGLEKKLVRIAALFDRINISAKSVGSISIGSVSSPSSRPSMGREKPAAFAGLQRKQTGAQEASKGTKRDTASSGLDAISQLHKLSLQYTDALGKSIGPAYKKDANRIISEGIKKGRSVDAIIRDLTGNAEQMSKTASMLGPQFQALKRVFGYISGWVKSVGSAVDNFLGSLGVHLRDIFPKEFIAAAGLFKALVRPIGDFAKSIGTAIFGKGNKREQDRVAKRVDAVTAALGDDKSLPSIQKILNRIAEEDNKKDGKSNFMDKLKGWLSNLPYIGPVIAALIGGLSKLKGVIASAGEFLWGQFKSIGLKLFEVAKDIPGYTKKLFGSLKDIGKWIMDSFSEAFSFLKNLSIENIFAGFEEALSGAAEVFTSVLEFFAELVIPLTALAGAAWGFISQLENIGKSIWGFAESFGGLISALGGYLYTWFQTATGPVADFIKSYIVPAFQLLGDALKMVFKVFESFGSSFGQLISSSFDLASALTDNATRDINAANKQMKTGALSPAQSFKDTMAMSSNTQNLSDNSDKTLDAQNITNDLLSRLVDKTGSTKNVVDINLKTKPKEFEASIKNREVDNFSASGDEGP